MRRKSTSPDERWKAAGESEFHLMKFAVDQCSDAVFWTGSEGHIVYVNEAACASLGYTRDELLSMPVQQLDASLATEGWPAFWQKLRQHQSLCYETRHRTKDGCVIPVEVRAHYVECRGKAYNCSFVRNGANREQSPSGQPRGKREHSLLLREIEQKTRDIQHTNQQLSALITIAAILGESLDLMTILREVIERITAIFHFDATRIYLYNSQGDELLLQASFETNPAHWSQVKKFRRGRGNVGLVAETGTPVVFEDIQCDPRYTELSHTQTSRKVGLRFFSAFPITSKQRTYGTIVCAGAQPRRLKPDEIQLITSMAKQIGVAVEHVRLFEETRTRAEELSTLYEIATVVNQSLDVELILRAAMHKVLERFAFDAARVYLYDKESKKLRLMAHEGFPADVAVPAMYELNSGILGRVFTSGEPMCFRDTLTDPDYHRLALMNRRMLKAGYRGQFFIPIAVKGSSLGVMSFVSKSAHSTSEVALIHSIARQLGVALENAELFSEIRRKADELEKINYKMQEANRIKDDFMASMSHELRTPLGAILGYTALLQDGYGGEVNQIQKEALQVVQHNSQMLLKLINDVLTLARIEAGKMTLDISHVSLEETLGHIRAYVRHLAQSANIRFLWNVQPGLPAISTDHFKLEEVLQNLLSNAYKFTPEGTVELRIQNLDQKKEIEFVVADTGIGIPPAELELVFEKFHQSQHAHMRALRGVGLGLSIVKNYIELMKGKIQVRSRPGEGTTFTFTLPYSISGEEKFHPPAQNNTQT